MAYDRPDPVCAPPLAAGRDRPHRGSLRPADLPVQLLRGPPLVPRGPALAGLLDEDLGPGRARLRLLRHLLRDAPGQPLRDATPRAEGGRAHARAGDRRTLPGERRAVPPMGHPARRRGPVDLRRPRRIRALAGVPPLAIQGRYRVREPGRLVRARSRVLRLHAPVAEVPPELALRIPGRHHGDRGDRAFPPGRDPAAGGGPRRQGRSAGARPPVGAARADPAGEGLGLLPGPLRPAHLRAGCGPRRLVHRRQRAAAGAHVPDHRGGDLRPALLRERAVPRLEPADHRRRAAPGRLDPARDGVPGLHPAVPRGAERAAEGAPLHRAEHRGDAARLRPGRDPPRRATVRESRFGRRTSRPTRRP